jgi:hypothetical protein
VGEIIRQAHQRLVETDRFLAARHFTDSDSRSGGPRI